MNKKGFQIKSGLFAIITMGIIVMAVGYWIDEWNTDYNSGLTYDLEGYSKLDEMSDYATNTKGNISAQSSYDEGSFEGTSLRGVFSVMNNIFTPFDVVFGKGGLISTIQKEWGVPTYIITGIISIMILAIIFAIIKLFFRQSSEV